MMPSVVVFILIEVRYRNNGKNPFPVMVGQVGFFVHSHSCVLTRSMMILASPRTSENRTRSHWYGSIQNPFPFARHSASRMMMSPFLRCALFSLCCLVMIWDSLTRFRALHNSNYFVLSKSVSHTNRISFLIVVALASFPSGNPSEKN